jgi:hypothetical protein
LNTGADGLFRGQAQRHYDFRKGEQLAKNDHIVQWKKPSKPEWMTQSAYDDYPDEVRVREFKVAGEVYVTTFLNDKKHHKKELAKIYNGRWQVEINLRSLKSVMNMDMLSCKTPTMVRKEIGIHFLAYNFIRVIIAQASFKHNALPNHISFKSTVQLINELTPHFLTGTASANKRMYIELLKQIVKNKVGNRPGRVEPRVIKRRRKPFPTLNRPRNIEKSRLIKNRDKRVSQYAWSL